MTSSYLRTKAQKIFGQTTTTIKALCWNITKDAAHITPTSVVPEYTVNNQWDIDNRGNMHPIAFFAPSCINTLPNVTLLALPCGDKIGRDLNKFLQNLCRQWCGCYDVIYKNENEIILHPAATTMNYVILTNKDILKNNKEKIEVATLNVGKIMEALPAQTIRGKRLVLDTRFSGQIVVQIQSKDAFTP